MLKDIYNNTYSFVIVLTILLFYALQSLNLTGNVLYIAVIAGMALGFYSLVRGSDIFIESASRIAKNMRVSEYLIGLTLVAFSTSLPEFAVSVIAAITKVEGIVIGNIIGSNIANIGLILGVSLILTKVVTSRKDRIDSTIMIGIEFILLLFLINDNVLSNYEGLVFILIYAVYLYYLKSREENRRMLDIEKIEHIEHNIEHKDQEKGTMKRDAVMFTFGVIGVIFGANLLIKSSVITATLLGVSDYIVGITLVAVGTSLPELATTVASVLKKKNEIMMGNIIGSNILNIVFVLGFASVVSPVSTAGMDIISPFIVLFIISTLLILFTLPKETKRYYGIILLAIYTAFIYMLVL